MNLTKEKETALMELREMLNDKHAQEIAVLQSRYHLELGHINKQNQKEKEEMALKHQLHMGIQLIDSNSMINKTVIFFG